MKFDADLHLHGLYSMAVSGKMVPKIMAEQSRFKGIDIVGTSDILHPKWRSMVKEETVVEAEKIKSKYADTYFILQSEVEDDRRVHHILLFPTFSSVEEVYEKLKPHSKNIEKEGRPRAYIGAAEIMDIVRDAGGDMGPAHAFTPWTSIYKEFDSISECYGGRKVCFLELGLSADTTMADQIPELSEISFLSNSDAHSPWPNKLGREFNRLEIEEPTFSEIQKAFKREGGRKITLNVGLDPRLGKYHESACIKCFRHFTTEESMNLNWRCPDCKGRIKKGVMDRINQLSNSRPSDSPAHRPPYVHVAPLTEIISLAIGIKNHYAKKVQALWSEFIKELGPETGILIDKDIRAIKKINEKVGETIKLFREGKIGIQVGGGGKYGELILNKKETQRNLGEWNGSG